MGATNTLYLCLHSQIRLDDMTNDATNPVRQLKETLGVHQALRSPVNTGGFEQIPVMIPGRSRSTNASNRKVVVQGRIKGCPTVQTTAIDVCAGSSAETSDLVDEEVYVPNYRGVTFTLDRQVYMDACDTPDGRAAAVVAYKIAEAIEQILVTEDQDHVTAMLAAATTYFDGTSSAVGSGTEKTVPLYSSTAPIIPQPGNMFLVLEEYRRKGYNMGVRPIVAGGTTLGRFAFDTNLYTGNVDGQDISKVQGILPTFIDYEIDSLAADGLSHLMSWIPGHVQKLTYLDYREGSPLRRSTPEITYGTTNFMGEDFDLVVYDASCDHLIDVTVSRYSGIWTLDNTFASNTCGGEQSILNWLVDCADTVCADISIPGNIIT